MTTKTTTKKGFDFARNSVYVADPLEVAIIGGAILTGDEAGPLDTGHRNGEHELYDVRIEEPLTEEFIASIDAFGVLQQVSVCKLEDGNATVCAGRQRIRAARVVNARRAARGELPLKVELKVVRSTGNRLLMTMVAENEARRDDSVMVKLEKLRALIARGVSTADAAVAFCISETYVQRLLDFDDKATVSVKAAAISGRLSVAAAGELAKIADPAAQDAKLAELIATPGVKPTVRAAAAAAKSIDGKKVGVVPTRRELSKLLVEVSDHTETAPEARVILDDERNDAKIKITRDHVVDAFYVGVEETLRLVLGKEINDWDLKKIFSKIRSSAE